jgi:hypothetical protein
MNQFFVIRHALSLVKIFNAIPSLLFSAPPELRSLTPNLYNSGLCSFDGPDL